VTTIQQEEATMDNRTERTKGDASENDRDTTSQNPPNDGTTTASNQADGHARDEHETKPGDAGETARATSDK
jgi:hypothetical protein